MSEKFIKTANLYLDKLCNKIKDRSVGSEGNQRATQFTDQVFRNFGWSTETPAFDVMDWQDMGATLICEGQPFKVKASPYSPGCDVKGKLICVSTLEELEKTDAAGKILFLSGEIAGEQLMPKNFVFYNPEAHKHIVYLLENSNAKAIISATGRNAALAGGVYPFPMIEDGDFDIPSVFMTEEEGRKLISKAGREIHLISAAQRIPSTASNSIAKCGINKDKKIVITAHIDAKKGSPGAIDNATGVVVLLLLAELLKDYSGKYQIELVALNGEDYYAVPGQMNYIQTNKENFGNILLNINIDGAGYKNSPSAFSYYQLPFSIKNKMKNIIKNTPDIVEGKQWVQGDHSIFVQSGIPAIAVSSKWFIDNIDSQTITHTKKDNLSIVKPEKIVQIAESIAALIQQLQVKSPA